MKSGKEKRERLYAELAEIIRMTASQTSAAVQTYSSLYRPGLSEDYDLLRKYLGDKEAIDAFERVAQNIGFNIVESILLALDGATGFLNDLPVALVDMSDGERITPCDTSCHEEFGLFFLENE